MQIFKAELKSWMLGEFAPLKSKHDSGIAEANQQNLLNVIANEVKQSFLHCHCEPKTWQSIQLHNNGLPRRYAPRNDDVVASNGLPRRYAPRNDDCNVCGRSMIEMLGVLAIIGVLSVGGIAGYSKAMEKWKINKAISEYNDFIFGILEYKDTLYKLPINNGYADIANSLGFFPKTLTYVDSRFAKDSLKQTMQMWKSIDKDRKNVLIFEIYFNDPEKSSYKESVQTLHYCRSFFSDFARPLDKVIISATLWRNTPSVPNISWYGSNYCSADRQCITDLSVTQIDEQCRTCADTKGSCTLLFTF